MDTFTGMLEFLYVFSVFAFIMLMPQVIVLFILAFKESIRLSIMRDKFYVPLSLTLPFIIWSLLCGLGRYEIYRIGMGKSWKNSIVEFFLLEGAVALLNGFFLITDYKRKTYWVLGIILVPFLVFFLVPDLPT